MVHSFKRLLGIFSVLIILFTTTAFARDEAPDTEARSAILLDAKTGQVLYDKKMHSRNAPASTTKIMTAILAVESGRLDETVRVSVRAAATRGSSMYLYPGQELTLRELVTGLMLRSGNDAAVAIAEFLAGSEESFVAMMNQKAIMLGAYNTHFANPHGLSAAGHYSTAYDLALLARYALSNPVFADIVSSKEANIDWLDRQGHEQDRNLRNTNRLLWMFEDADGVKTGTTNEAGPCLVSSATRSNHKLIAVVLHDHSRWYDSMKLLRYGFDHFDLYDYANAGDTIGTIPVEQGMADTIEAVVSATASLVTTAAEFSKISVELDLPEKIKAPVFQGQKIGEIVFFIGEKPVKTVDVVANRDVEERTLAKTFLQHLVYTFRALSGWGIL